MVSYFYNSVKNMKTDSITVMSSRGQIVIPKFIRDYLGLHYGSQITMNVRADKVIELHSLNHNIDEFFGKGKNGKNGKTDLSVVDIDDAIMQAVGDNNNIC